MADTKLSSLSAVTSVATTDLVYVVQSAGSGGLKATVSQLLTPVVVTEYGTSRDLSAADNGKLIYCTSASAVTVNTAASLGAGFSCVIMQGAAGQVTVAQGAGTTLAGYGAMYKTAGQYAVISVISPVADTFIVSGMSA